MSFASVFRHGVATPYVLVEGAFVVGPTRGENKRKRRPGTARFPLSTSSSRDCGGNNIITEKENCAVAKSPPIMQAPLMIVLYLCLYLGAVLGGCSALSVRIDSGYLRTASHARISIHRDASTTYPFSDHLPASRPSNDGESTLFGMKVISRNAWCRFQPADSPRADDDNTKFHNKYISNENATANLLHSIALVASCRRLSFLFISIAVMNFVRSTILKASRRV